MRKTSSGVIFLFLALIITTCWSAGCGESKNALGAEETKEKDAQPTPVKTAKVYYGPIRKCLSFTGNVFAIRETKISSKIPGKTAEIKVSEASVIEGNDALVLLDQEDLKISVKQAEAALETAKASLEKVLAGTRKEQIEQAKAGLEQAKAGLEQAKANLEHARLSQSRMQDLLKSSSIPKSQFDLTKMQVDMAEAQVDMANAQIKAAEEQYSMAKEGATKEDIAIVQANVKMAEVGLLAAQTQLNNSIIKAPFDGTITAKTISEGEMVAPGVPLLTLSDMTTVKVEFGIPEEYFGTVNKGNQGIVRMDAYPGHTFEGALTLKNPYVDKASRTFMVQLEIPNTDKMHMLAPGMFARIELVLTEKKQALLVPVKAVLEREGKKYVIVINETGQPQERIVETDLSNEHAVEIVSGLKAGEEVIVEGNYGLKPGSPIRIEK